ncbi:C-8 sterol isomerase [Auriculariales sp. MPI-PUGE-AT-0066]|nr:C-8 sterol isomerase [Auriculariales sp. MPI-PUGE-AT-0066]
MSSPSRKQPSIKSTAAPPIKPSVQPIVPTQKNKAGRDPVKKWFGLIALFFVLVGTCSWLEKINHTFFIFDRHELHELAQSSIKQFSGKSNATSLMIDNIVTTLAEKYGTKHININQKEWTFNNAGGAMGAMYIIHASITEYLIIFGTPLGTEGHTGRHFADDYFNILEGEQWAFKAGALEKEVYPAGSVHHLRRGERKQYKMHENCFALEYAAGWIPLMVPFGLADLFFSTLDFETLWETIYYTGREMGRNLLVGKI